jgi:hypothetical protein
LQEAILKQLNWDKADFLSTVLCTQPGRLSSLIGSLARVVTDLGFRRVDPDQDAITILQGAADCLADLLNA